MSLENIEVTQIEVFLIVLIFGLIFGSFSSVLALRVPEGRSVVTPPSACPNCKRALSPWENFPLVSYLALKGRCRSCNTPIGKFYPLMEIGTATLYVAAIYFGGITPLGLAYTGFAVITLPLLWIDLKYKRLPNLLTYSGFLWGLFVAALSAVIDADIWEFAEPIITGAACATFFLVLNLISKGGMGMGDIKLAGVIGVTLAIANWQHAVFGILLGFLLGGLISILLLVSKRAEVGTAIPFGPWMLAGAWFAIVLGPDAAMSTLKLWTISS